MTDKIIFEDITYSRSMTEMDAKYRTFRKSIEFHKLEYNNSFDESSKVEIRTMVNTILRRFCQYFIEQDSIAKSRDSLMYTTEGEPPSSEKIEHTTPLGSDKKEETGRLYQYFRNEISVDELLWSPITRSNEELKSKITGKHVYLNEDPTHFFNRYLDAGFEGPIKTWKNVEVDLRNWDFNDHISQVIKPHPVWGELWNKYSK